MNHCRVLFAVACFIQASALGQSTQGWLSGRVMDSISAQPLSGATVRCLSVEKGTETVSTVDSSGRFAFASLSPGEYTLVVEQSQYQSQEYDRLLLPVAGQIGIEFRLTPVGYQTEAKQKAQIFLPELNQILAFYGPDLDLSRRQFIEPKRVVESNLEPSVSTVITARDLRELPLQNRDAYTLLVLLPGVTSNSSTARGLGFSVSGQRPSSANYLLDGLENNNLLVTGPVGAVVPEFIEEYRISTNNFSAEYGRTSGFLANAITRSGAKQWHGSIFNRLRNEALDANGFQENLKGIRRAPLKEQRPGFTVTGPALVERLFVSGALQLARFRSSRDPETYVLPTAKFIANLPSSTTAGRLLRLYPASVVPVQDTPSASVQLAPPVAIDQILSLLRLDWSNRDNRHHVFARGSVTRNRQPYLLYNPYPGFSSPFQQGSVNIGASWMWQLSPTLSQELRVGRLGDAARYDRPHSEIPQLDVVGDNRMDLPFSTSSFGYRNRTQNWDIANNWTYMAGPHRVKAGVGLFRRTIHNDFTVDRDGSLFYLSLDHFLQDTPLEAKLADDQTRTGFQPAPYGRDYRYHQGDFFIQDAVQLTPRIGVSIGLRGDWQTAPVNIGVNKDNLIELGSGGSFAERLAGASYASLPSGNQAMFQQQGLSWGPRLGISYDVTGTGTTLLRASYGVYYDRFFDGLWQADVNREQIVSYRGMGQVRFLDSFAPTVLTAGTNISQSQHRAVLFQPHLRSPMVQSAFAGVQHRIARGITVEANGLTSRGRRLWTSDIVNRRLSVSGNSSGKFTDKLPETYYRGDQGSSQYSAATVMARVNRARWSALISYTLSHTQDNQSDPLAGVFQQFDQAGLAGKDKSQTEAAFARQFDSNADYGNADFDQRHNLTFFGVYELPALAGPRGISTALRGWRVSGTGAIRSGLPFSVLASSAGRATVGGFIYNQRADLTNAALLYQVPNAEIAGGRQLLNQAAFTPPSASSVGGTARNAFYGPGLFNLDLSLAKRFSLSRMGETSRLTLRADAFNLLNHANLNTPQNNYYNDFGAASYGRRDKGTGFPAQVPLSETPRQFQVSLEFEF